MWHGRGQGQGQAVAQGLRCLIQTFEFTLKPHKNARAKRNENNRYEVHSQWSAGRGKEGECRIGIFILTWTVQRTRHQNDSILWRHRCGCSCSCSCCCSFRCLTALLLLLYVCVFFFFVFPTVALSFTYRPAARTSLCACDCVRVPGACHVCRLNDLRHFCQLLLPHTFAILFLLTGRMTVCASLCLCVCVLLALNKTNTHTHTQTGTRRETWQKQQRMPHTFVFIMLNVSWGQQDHTLHTDKDYNSNLCCLLSALVVVLLVALVIVVSVLIQWASLCFCKCSNVTACVCHNSHFTFIQFQFQLASLCCVFYLTRAPKSMQHTINQAASSLACLCTCRFQHTSRRFSWDWQCVAFVSVRIGSFVKFTHTRVAQPNAQHDSCRGESSLPKLSWIELN